MKASVYHMMKLPPAGPSELSLRGSSGSAGKVEGNFEISVRHTDLVTHRTQSRHSDLFELEAFCHLLFSPPLPRTLCRCWERHAVIWDSLIEMLQVEAPTWKVWTGGPDSWIYHNRTATRNRRAASLGYIAAQVCVQFSLAKYQEISALWPLSLPSIRAMM